MTLLYFWLNSPEFAKQRVAIRVSKGGHNIPLEIIERRYYRGLKNFLTLYRDSCDKWMLIDNMKSTPALVAESNNLKGMHVVNPDTWKLINKLESYGNE